MKIWYDACTGKHVRYGVAIVRRLKKAGHRVIFTTRRHPDTLLLAKALGENPLAVGSYNPASLFTRIRESANRMLLFADMFKNNKPDLAIGSQSVELSRVAFGLGIPTILTADTPHADAVNRLTVPLANTLVISEALPRSLYEQYGAKKIRQFRGVDEVAWIRGFEPSTSYKFQKPLILVRQMETRATYSHEKNDVTSGLLKDLTSLGNVLFVPRYTHAQKQIAGRLIVTKEFLDSASLAGYSDLVVSVGGTVSREAALQGTPSIVISEFGKIQVNDYLASKGFPIFTVNPTKVMELAKKHIGKKRNFKAILAELENPIDLIEELVRTKDFD